MQQPPAFFPRIKLKIRPPMSTGGSSSTAGASVPAHRRQASVTAEGFGNTPVARVGSIKVPTISLVGLSGTSSRVPTIHRKGGKKRPRPDDDGSLMGATSDSHASSVGAGISNSAGAPHAGVGSGAAAGDGGRDSASFVGTPMGGQTPAKRPRQLEQHGANTMIRSVLTQLMAHPFAGPFLRSFYSRGENERGRTVDW